MLHLPSPGKWSLQTFKLLCFCISWWYPHFLQDPHSEHELQQMQQRFLQTKALSVKGEKCESTQFPSRLWPSYGPVSNWQARSFHPRLVYPLVIYPQLYGRTERTKQEPEAAVRCVVLSETLTSSASGLSPFESSLSYQPPLLPNIEGTSPVPSV